MTVSNFLLYAESGFYDGADGAGETTFHRVVEDFVAQGGGYSRRHAEGHECAHRA